MTNVECPVCLAEKGSLILQSSCIHLFCSECLLNIMKLRSDESASPYPLCRSINT